MTSGTSVPPAPGPGASTAASAPPLHALVFVLSAALLMLEIGLTRVFSAMVFYHFAFMAISLGMFGIAAGGLLVHVRRPWRWPGAAPAAPAVELARLAVLFAVLNLAGFLVAVRLRISFAEGGGIVPPPPRALSWRRASGSAAIRARKARVLMCEVEPGG